jgi:hypothetical protein
MGRSLVTRSEDKVKNCGSTFYKACSASLFSFLRI